MTGDCAVLDSVPEVEMVVVVVLATGLLLGAGSDGRDGREPHLAIQNQHPSV